MLQRGPLGADTEISVGPRRRADIDMEPTPWVLHQARASADENENLQ